MRATLASLKSVPKINVRNLQRAVKVDLPALETFARRARDLCLALPKEKKSDLVHLVNIDVLLISDRRIAELHRRFQNVPGPTDVITFQHGEIFISAQSAQRQAREFGSSLAGEIRLYIVHGLLHLHGYDDKTRPGARRMQATQKRILRAASKISSRK